MSNGGVNFNGPIQGDAKVNAGDGTWIEGDQNNVAGDQATHGGNLAKDQASIDVGGQLFQYGGVLGSDAEAFFTSLVDLCPHDDSLNDGIEQQVDDLTPEELEEIMEYSDLVKKSVEISKEEFGEPDPEELARVQEELDTPKQVFKALKEQQDKPEEEQDKGKIAAILETAKRHSPVIARAALAFGRATLSAMIKTPPLIAGALAVVDVIIAAAGTNLPDSAMSAEPSPGEGGNYSDDEKHFWE